MKKILKFLILILIIGCKTNTSDKNIDFNEFIEKNDNYDHIIGPVNRNELEKYPFSMWFDKNYKDYLIDSETTSLIGKLINDFDHQHFFANLSVKENLEHQRFHLSPHLCKYPHFLLHNLHF